MTKNCGKDCPEAIRFTLSVIGDKYSALILRMLHEGEKRFKDFEHEIPDMSPRTLSQRLDRLQELSVIDKVTCKESPGRYSYVLTQNGRELNDVIHSMAVWGARAAEDKEI